MPQTLYAPHRPVVHALACVLIACCAAPSALLAAPAKPDPMKDKAVLEAKAKWEKAQSEVKDYRDKLSEALKDETAARREARVSGAPKTSPEVAAATEEVQAARTALDELKEKAERKLRGQPAFDKLAQSLAELKRKLSTEEAREKPDAQLIKKLTQDRIDTEQRYEAMVEGGIAQVEGGPEALKKLQDAEERLKAARKKQGGAAPTKDELAAETAARKATAEVESIRKALEQARKREDTLLEALNKAYKQAQDRAKGKK